MQMDCRESWEKIRETLAAGMEQGERIGMKTLMGMGAYMRGRQGSWTSGG